MVFAVKKALEVEGCASASLYDCVRGGGLAASARNWRIEEGGGLTGDLALSLTLDGGRRLETLGCEGILLLRAFTGARFGCCAFWSNRLGLRSTSSPMTRPISKSSSGCGLATLGFPSAGWFFLSSRIRFSFLGPLSNKPEGIKRPSSWSSSSSSVSVSGCDADV